MIGNGFTPTQRAILDVLSDGRPHTREELRQCLPDDLGDVSNIHAHLVALRKVLRPIGHEIICEWVSRQPWYRHVLLLAFDRGDGGDKGLAREIEIRPSVGPTP